MSSIMSTLEMEIALIKFFEPSRNLIVPNVSWGLGLSECDLLILTKAGYATEIEIKIAKSDLIRDKKKKHEHNKNSNLVKYLYFAVPSFLVRDALEVIPKRAGLYKVKKIYTYDRKTHYRVILIKKAEANRYAKAWMKMDKYRLARLGALRILHLKEKILKLKKIERAYQIFVENKK